MNSFMKSAQTYSTLAAVLLAGSAWVTHAASTDEIAKVSDPELRACIDRSLPKHSLSYTTTFLVKASGSAPVKTVAKFDWLRSANGLFRARVQVDESPTLRGFVALLSESKSSKGDPTLRVFSPETGKSTNKPVRTLDSGSSLGGTDFSYEDFAFMQVLLTNDEVKRQPDIEFDGNLAIVLETTPTDEDARYSRIRATVDKAWCVPVKMEFYGQNGKLDKEIAVARGDIGEFDGHRVPTRAVMTNHKGRSSTELSLSDIRFETDIPESAFSSSGLGSPR